MPAYDRARALTENKVVWLAPLMVVIACSGSDDTNFFEPRAGGGTGGSSTGGTVGGTGVSGSAGGGTTSVGGSAGDANGGSSGQTGGTDATGGSDPQGGSSAGDGMGGSSMAGMAGQGGDAGAGKSGDGGMAGTGMAGGGMGGAGMAGGGMGGAGTAGAGMGGAGMAGAGMGGAGTGGTGKGGAAGAAGCTPTTPSMERCDGVDNNCMGGIDEGMTCPDGCTGATRGGHYYIFCSFEADTGGMGSRFRTWTQAQDFCTMRQTSLVFIDSAEEDAFILEWITRMQLEDQVWTGGNDRDAGLSNNEGEWVWGTTNSAVQFWEGDENGMPVMNRYSDWAAGEPNNMGNEDCAVLSSDHNFHWDDRVCTNQYLNFVCESTAAPTTN